MKLIANIEIIVVAGNLLFKLVVSILYWMWERHEIRILREVNDKYCK
jgi:hypothetical protein